jgi:hypothetical protein
MKCEFSDGTKVNYTGPVQITKGQDVNVFIKEAFIPSDIKSDLDMALYRNSCGEMRSIADTITQKFGKKACIHE